MSDEARAAVQAHSRQRGNAYAVMLALAELATPDGCVRARVKDIADLAHASERTVQSVLPRIERAGELSIERGIGRGILSRYRLTLPNLHHFIGEKGADSGEMPREKVQHPAPFAGEKVQIREPSVQQKGADSVSKKVQHLAPFMEDGPVKVQPSAPIEAEKVQTVAPFMEHGGENGASSPSLIKRKRSSDHEKQSPKEKGEAALADAAFMAEIREEYPTVRLERQAKRWIEHLAETNKPPKANYKNAFRNWLDNAIKWGHEPGPTGTVNDGSTTQQQQRPRAPSTNGAIGAARDRDPAAPGSGLGRYGRRGDGGGTAG